MATQTIGNNPNPEARYILNDSAATGYVGTLNVNTSIANSGNQTISGTLAVTGAFTGSSTAVISGLLTANSGVTVASSAGTGTTFNVSGMLSNQVIVAGTATTDTSEDVLFTYTLPASTLGVNGQVLEIFAAGTLGTAASTKTVKIYFGTAVYTLFSATQASLNWTANVMVSRVGSASALFVATGTVGTTPTASTVIADTDILTAGVVIKTTGQEASAANSGVKAYCQQVFLCT